MERIRFHGRGGQGAVLGAEILSAAFLRDGKQTLFMPLFGSERRGAPVVAFVRASDTKIREKGRIEYPDCVVVLSSALFEMAPVTAGLRQGGMVLLNSAKEPESFDSLKEFQVVTIDADSIARKHSLGSAIMPVPNTAVLGAFVKATGLINLSSVLEEIKERIPVQKDENVAAAKEAYNSVKMPGCQGSKVGEIK